MKAKTKEEKRIRVLEEQRRRDRKRLLKIKEAHREYHKKVDSVLNQIKIKKYDKRRFKNNRGQTKRAESFRQN